MFFAHNQERTVTTNKHIQIHYTHPLNAPKSPQSIKLPMHP